MLLLVDINHDDHCTGVTPCPSCPHRAGHVCTQPTTSRPTCSSQDKVNWILFERKFPADRKLIRPSCRYQILFEKQSDRSYQSVISSERNTHSGLSNVGLCCHSVPVCFPCVYVCDNFIIPLLFSLCSSGLSRPPTWSSKYWADYLYIGSDGLLYS